MKICIYHGNCVDGFTAAWAVRAALGDVDVKYAAGVYQEPSLDVTGADVIMVDFSYKRPVIEEMAKSARSILILDHHKSTMEDLAGFQVAARFWEAHKISMDGLMAAGWPAQAAPVRVLFDMNRSGAGIAWDFFHPDKMRPLAINYIEDRDLGGGIARAAKHAATREFSMGLLAYEYDFALWDKLMQDDTLEYLINEGEMIDRKHMKDIRELLALTKRKMTIGGFYMPVASMPYTMASDAGNTMAVEDGAQVAACYYDTPNHRVFSLRSITNGPDCSIIAREYGGGGHYHAAGFRVDRSHELACS